MNWMTDPSWGPGWDLPSAVHTAVETHLDVSRSDARRVADAIEASLGTFRLPEGAGIAVVRSVHHAHPDVVVRTEVPGGATLEAVLRDERPGLAVRMDLVVAAVDAVVDALAVWTRLGPVHGAVSTADVWVDARGKVTVEGFGLVAAWTQLARACVVAPVDVVQPEPFCDLRAGSADVFSLGVLVGTVLLGVPVPAAGGAVAFRNMIARRLEGPATLDDGFEDAVEEMLDANPALATLFGGGHDLVARVGRRLAPRLDDQVLADLARLVLEATALEPRMRLRPEAFLDELLRLQRHLDADEVEAWRAGRPAVPAMGTMRRRPSWLGDVDRLAPVAGGMPTSTNREAVAQDG